ncbi:MAG: hypothetical protein HYY91_02905 [Candidatus Omnitrophica bacterium]|nr:hypothetical protein [Candidatus Omnitrophota bacterium]
MTYRHRALAAGRWRAFAFVEQMANVGGEVERMLNWRARQQPAHAEQAFERALELLDLTLVAARSGPRLKEVARVREALVDYWAGANGSASTDASWRRYFLPFAYAARRTR